MKINKTKKNLNGFKVNVAFLSGVIFLLLMPARLLFIPNDHEGYLDIMDQTAGGEFTAGLRSKEYVALTYNYIGKFIPLFIFSNLVFYLYILIITSKIERFRELVFFLFMSFFIFSYFNYVTKEAILLILLVLPFLVKTRKLTRTVWFYLSIGVYAFLIRPYYAVAIAFGICIMIFGKKIGILVSSISGLVLLYLYPEPFEALDNAGILMWNASYSFHGTRSVFPRELINITLPSFQSEFLYRYFGRLVYGIFPSVWLGTFVDYLAQIVVISYLFLIGLAFKIGDKMYSSFGLGLFLVLPAFVTDIGTFSRHLGSVGFFMFLSIAVGKDHNFNLISELKRTIHIKW